MRAPDPASGAPREDVHPGGAGRGSAVASGLAGGRGLAAGYLVKKCTYRISRHKNSHGHLLSAPRVSSPDSAESELRW